MTLEQVSCFASRLLELLLIRYHESLVDWDLSPLQTPKN